MPAALAAALGIGCASFDLPPYDLLARDAADRTAALERTPRTARVLNRAAQLPGHSQAQIKPQLESLWRPSLSPLCLANYNGLIATWQSQLEIKPGPMFRDGVLEVEHLGRPTVLHYIAAFHPGRRLPLVVGVSGINGTVDGKVTLEILQHLYATGGFHVLHFESVTSVDHMARNQRVFAGGFPEALLLYESLARLRAQPEFADQIDQIHLLGISYGGMLCGLAGHCEAVFRGGVVDGAVLCFSPPLDLRVLFENLDALPFLRNWIRKTYVLSARDRYLKTVRPGLSEQEWRDIDFDSYTLKIAFPYVRANYAALKARFPDLPPIDTPQQLYAISSLRPFLGQLGVPYYYVVAYDDPVVSPEDHFHQVLAACPNALVDGTVLPHGGHLGFDAVCGYPFTAYVAECYFRYWSANAAVSSADSR